MPNKQRGIAELVINGKKYNLQLTLDALAELEDGLGLESLIEIQAALNPPKAKKLKVILASLILGGGDVSESDDKSAMDNAMTIAGSLTVTNLMALPEKLGAVIEMAMDDGDENPPEEAAPQVKGKKRSR